MRIYYVLTSYLSNMIEIPNNIDKLEIYVKVLEEMFLYYQKNATINVDNANLFQI
jgi:hypothetical protein